jgi:glycine dehydrogenase
MLNEIFKHTDKFANRHIGLNSADIEAALKELDEKSLDSFISKVIPEKIRTKTNYNLPNPESEFEALEKIKSIAKKNKVFKSYIGLGYYNTITPTVIKRNILENPGWYTQYTPYQAEISQGRLQALLNFQTMVSDLTGLPISNASLLDEATAAAEAVSLAYNVTRQNEKLKNTDTVLVSKDIFPQTLAVLKTRLSQIGINIKLEEINEETTFNDKNIFALLVQNPSSSGLVYDYTNIFSKTNALGIINIIGVDILSLTLIKTPKEMGAQIAYGSTQRFGLPLGFGGPHSAFLSTIDEFKRNMPGRIVGVSVDSKGRKALRLALQTREQHIRREKATSNICTAQSLLAIMSSMYAVYHGPVGLKKIAKRIHDLTQLLAYTLKNLNYKILHESYFDTLSIISTKEQLNKIKNKAIKNEINFYYKDENTIQISLDETVTYNDFIKIISCFEIEQKFNLELLNNFKPQKIIPERTTKYLTHPIFNQYHTEHELLRYIKSLEKKDLSLTTSMISLGSCTMKLNATTELEPISFDEFSKLHPFAPLNQAEGYLEIFKDLEKWLCEITGFDAFSLQPNAGSQGEFTGLLVIKKYHEENGNPQRNVCLIPKSAHGTNPASASICGLKVVVVECDKNGNVDLNDLKSKASLYKDTLCAAMITYPSTHGVFEEGILDFCKIVHDHGGLVYMDGANMNALVGLCKPSELGADVCHINLHKTFCIPHGGGGPGMGPIGVTSKLKNFLPTHPLVEIPNTNKDKSIGTVSAAPWGSPLILPISWMYILMMGQEGLTLATKIAILNANYIAKKLSSKYPVLYKGQNNKVAHECIIDLRKIKDEVGIDVEDIAKRLMDYGYHAPTISFPVVGTMMIEPTESESLKELNQFIDAMLKIYEEIEEIKQGKQDRQNNTLKNAPHTAFDIAQNSWDYPYSREKAVFPNLLSRENKFWPSVSRINNVLGDRNLICTCPSIDDYS